MTVEMPGQFFAFKVELLYKFKVSPSSGKNIESSSQLFFDVLRCKCRNSSISRGGLSLHVARLLSRGRRQAVDTRGTQQAVETRGRQRVVRVSAML